MKNNAQNVEKSLNNEISIYPFKFKHLQYLYELLNSNSYIGVSEITMKTLPKIGYIAFLGKQPIAAGFLRRVEPCYAQLDTLTSHAFYGSEIRHKGVQLVVASLIEDAERLKLEGVIGLTADSGILKRALELGFHVVDQTFVAKKL